MYHTRVLDVLQMHYMSTYVIYDPHTFYINNIRCGISYVRARAVCYRAPNILFMPQAEGLSRLGSCLSQKDERSHNNQETGSTTILVCIF